jgi:hypothetical protein
MVFNNIPTSPYVIGLTGGIASGKSALCGRLEKLGAGVVDCDKLGTVHSRGRRGRDHMVVGFIGGGNRRTLRKPSTCHKSLRNFIT